jgi:hypothetical protein
MRSLVGESHFPNSPVAAITSPDGAHLAIAGWTRQSNVWMLTDF